MDMTFSTPVGENLKVPVGAGSANQDRNAFSVSGLIPIRAQRQRSVVLSALEIVCARQRLSQEWHVRQAWKLTCGSASMVHTERGRFVREQKLATCFCCSAKKNLRNVSRPRRCFDLESLVLRKVSTVAAQTCRLTHSKCDHSDRHAVRRNLRAAPQYALRTGIGAFHTRDKSSVASLTKWGQVWKLSCRSFANSQLSGRSVSKSILVSINSRHCNSWYMRVYGQSKCVMPPLKRERCKRTVSEKRFSGRGLA
jgi:hypothetical protein